MADAEGGLRFHALEPLNPREVFIVPAIPSSRAAVATLAGLALAALPLSAQVYPGVEGDPPYLDVSCLCDSEVPPPGEYVLASNVAYTKGRSIPTKDGFATRVDVGDCGASLRLTTGSGTVSLTRQSLGETQVYRGPYDANDGVRGTMTLVMAERDGLPFEPAVRFVMRGEADAAGVHYPLVLQLKSTAPEAFAACKCALMGRYYEKIAQYRESFTDRSLIEEAKRRKLSLPEFQAFVGEARQRRRAALDGSLGRTPRDEIPGGGGSTTLDGAIHIEDLDMLDRGVPPEMIESVHVHEEVHQRRRLSGVKINTVEDLAADEVEAAEAQLEFLESWLRESCPRWRKPLLR